MSRWTEFVQFEVWLAPVLMLGVQLLLLCSDQLPGKDHGSFLGLPLGRRMIVLIVSGLFWALFGLAAILIKVVLDVDRGERFRYFLANVLCLAACVSALLAIAAGFSVVW